MARDDEGLVYVPIMDQLEAELARARHEEDPVYRARRLLSAHSSQRTIAASR